MAYTPLVLYSIKDEKKAQQITALCKKLGVHTKEIQTKDVDEKVGVLAGIDPLTAMGAICDAGSAGIFNLFRSARSVA